MSVGLRGLGSLCHLLSRCLHRFCRRCFRLSDSRLRFHLLWLNLLTDGSSLRLGGRLFRCSIRLNVHRALANAIKVYLSQRCVFLVSSELQPTHHVGLGAVPVFLLLRLLEETLSRYLNGRILLVRLNERSILLVVELEVEIVLDLPKHTGSLLQEANCRLAPYVQFT